MPEKTAPNLGVEDIDHIIRKIVDNPTFSKEKINELAGIGSRQSRENLLLTPWILDNTRLVLGEDIDLRQNEELRSLRDDKIYPDLVGKDLRGYPIIVEVKFKFDYPEDKKQNRTDPEYMAIGQILQYSRAYRREYPSTEDLRLLIVSIDYSPDVEDVCKFLRSKSIDIRYISIKKILCK